MRRTDELLYIETDGGCANCGLRDNRVLTVHHLDPTNPKDESYDNKLLLCHNCHQCHHHRKEPTDKELRDIKRRLITKTLTRPGLNALKLAHRQGAVVAMPFLVNHLVELEYLRYTEPMSTWSHDEHSKENVSEGVYVITAAGKKLLTKWRLR